MLTPLFIDFEASCLPRDGRSFPIEVGLANGTGWSRSWLIRPESGWADWGWTAEAEGLHGLTRETLLRDGQPVAVVMAELNAVAGGHRVYADHDLDRRWLATLAEAAAIVPAFNIAHVAEWLDLHRPEPWQVEQAVAIADRSVAQRHRAEPDARWLAALASQIGSIGAGSLGWPRQAA
jgi:hypothetical protein